MKVEILSLTQPKTSPMGLDSVQLYLIIDNYSILCTNGYNITINELDDLLEIKLSGSQHRIFISKKSGCNYLEIIDNNLGFKLRIYDELEEIDFRSVEKFSKIIEELEDNSLFLDMTSILENKLSLKESFNSLASDYINLPIILKINNELRSFVVNLLGKTVEIDQQVFEIISSMTYTEGYIDFTNLKLKRGEVEYDLISYIKFLQVILAS